ncbi:MAG: hypothetical protein CM1200mP40_09220 [Gammaproteobacteria bacterium]|nr:MAG: hypothetical protein CM1200mP40_09220 [Gammaproteobacteria bacterium]
MRLMANNTLPCLWVGGFNGSSRRTKRQNMVGLMGSGTPPVAFSLNGTAVFQATPPLVPQPLPSSDFIVNQDLAVEGGGI